MGRMCCGTQEEWDKYKSGHPDMYIPIPATVYVNRKTVCLVTSKELADWLHGETNTIPIDTGGNSSMNKSSNLFTNEELIDYYRRNPIDFTKDILGVKLRWYQELYLRLLYKVRR